MVTTLHQDLELYNKLGERAPACFLCRLILEDLRKNGRLTNDYPPQGPLIMEADAVFPIKGKEAHLKLERL
jgi:hypothetical protein